jgi:TorA-specific chaperone
MIKANIFLNYFKLVEIIMVKEDTARERTFILDGLDLLSALFAGPGPDCRELASRRIPAFAEDLGKAPEELAGVFADLVKAWSPDDPAGFCRRMESEYVRIFINTKGGVAAPLYHSVYQAGSSGLMGPAARDMARRISESGLAIGAEGEPADHLCVEIEYLSRLLAGGGPGIPEPAMGFARVMSEWIPDFRDAVKRSDPPAAYGLAADALVAVIDHLADSS